jgi:hypothetical protein
VNPWSNLCRHLFTPIDVQHTVAPPDVVPLADLMRGETVHLEDTAQSVELEREARVRQMLRHIQRTLLTESFKDPNVRNQALLDFCLEARSILQPAPVDATQLREVPPLGIRYPTPVIPGGAS